ncbi:hypothetical protein GF386_06590 [Candidatus Pacearchaeota archaeon]|nr:hypothetical protein [Candidatus Pacearchaeota archaeon]MBD3283762.1 hypothetical protein [Candidatus Pacearchaeota archaeon]
MPNSQCYYCNNTLNNNDYVAVTEAGRLLHYLICDFDDDEPGGCLADAIDNAFEPDLVSFDLGVLYNGKVYDEADITKLPNFRELSIGLNEQRTGSRVIGDISGLLEIEPIFEI